MTKLPFAARTLESLVAVLAGTFLVQFGGLSLGWWPVTLLAGVAVGLLVRGWPALVTALAGTLAAWGLLMWSQSDGRAVDAGGLVAALAGASIDAGAVVVTATLVYAAGLLCAGIWLGGAIRRTWLRASPDAAAPAPGTDAATDLARHPRVRVFNRVADTYDARFGDETARMHGVVFDWVDADGHTPQRVLDIGCGTGAFLAAAARRWPGVELVGVDPAEGMLRHARAALPEAQLHLGVAERLPVPDASVDTVVSTTSFGQWTDQPAGLREIHRVLAPGGRCYLVEHTPVFWLLRLLLRVPDFRDPARLHDLATGSGLRVRRLEVVDRGLVAISAGPATESLHI